MSYEGGVTPSDMMQDIMPKAGNAWFLGKGALGKWRCWKETIMGHSAQ